MNENKPSKLRDAVCAWCHGTGEVGSEIHHGASWTIAVDRKTEQCPHCKGSGKEPTARPGTLKTGLGGVR